MKNFKSLLILVVLFSTQMIFSQQKTDSLHMNHRDSSNYSKMIDSMMNAYSKQNEAYKKQMEKQKENQRGLGNSLFGLTIDLILGVGFSKTTFDVNKDTAGLSNPNTVTGPMIGANINLRLVGFAIGTGFNYSSKGFTTTNSNSYNANYINIPLLFTFNFDIKKVGIELTAGPYVGILLSHDKTQLYELKNIDIGILASVQGTYFFNRFLGTLLGVKYEQGGLNNSLKTGSNNSYVSSIKTTNWFIYSGIKFVL
jgi:hypothetical protein